MNLDQRKKICIVTGGRSDYGLLRPLIKELSFDKRINLDILVTGMHLSSEFGMTIKEIEQDGFKISQKVEMLLNSDTSVGITKSIGLGLSSFAEVFDNLLPDLVILLGDRFEIFAVATAAFIAKIPIAHLHGGELTEGSLDDTFRHCITKMSSIHFVSSKTYRKRVIQLGENPDNVFTVGAIGLDNLRSMRILNKKNLETHLDFKFLKKNLLITFHPFDSDKLTIEKQMKELLLSLSSLSDTGLIITMPNADKHGKLLQDMIKKFVSNHQNAKYYCSLGQLMYLSCMHHVDGVIGNSSSGLIEAPALKKGTINIGDRQKGRLKAKSIIDCKSNQHEISKSINYLFTNEFQNIVKNADNPYGKHGATKKIIKIINKTNFNKIKKVFYDITKD